MQEEEEVEAREREFAARVPEEAGGVARKWEPLEVGEREGKWVRVWSCGVDLALEGDERAIFMCSP